MATCVMLGSIKEDPALVFPLLTSRISAGFPSPASDYLAKAINLGDLLVQHPAATFLMKVEGNSMINAGINDGDLIVIDRAIEPAHRKIVVAAVDGEFLVKRLIYRDSRCFLVAENSSYRELEVSEYSDNQIWGVVIHVIHAIK
jgi:DNA polymerase V